MNGYNNLCDLNMLQLVQHKISILKTSSHYFLSSTHHHIVADQYISNTLLDHPIYHNSPPIADHYFFEVWITMLTTSFTISSCGSCLVSKLADFCNIFEKFHKLEWKIQSQKIAIFDLLEPLDWRLQVFLLYIRIYTILYSDFPFFSRDYSFLI